MTKHLIYSACVLALGASVAGGADGNRLTYLDSDNPFWPGLAMPKFITPQWVEDKNVEAVVILAIDDMRAPEPFASFLEPVLDRLRKIDGTAPVSIMVNKGDATHSHFQTFLKDGLSLDVHTLNHPCPLLSSGGMEGPRSNYHGGVDYLRSIPGNIPVAYRMPCCDSMNSPSPRFYAAIFNEVSPGGHFLSIDSSIMNMTNSKDKTLPADLVKDPDGGERFEKYFPKELKRGRKLTLENFATTIENYPYPYVIGNLCWEFPCAVPSDWEAFNYFTDNANPGFLEDWKKALDLTVLKQGQMTTIFHTYGWSSPEQLVQFVDYAQEKYGKRVKFLTFADALKQLEKTALRGHPLRASNGQDNGTRLMDVNNDGFMDIVTGIQGNQVTRVWEPQAKQWNETATPFLIVQSAHENPNAPSGIKFATVHGDGSCSAILNTDKPAAWTFREGKWTQDKHLLAGLEPFKMPDGSRDHGLRFRDFNQDGRCEALISNAQQNAILHWHPETKLWKAGEYALPEAISLVDAEGKFNGLYFVDLNGDGFEDVIQSNQNGSSIYLWATVVKNEYNWKAGWSHHVRTMKEAGDIGVMKGNALPTFTMDGENAGVWFAHDSLFIQNQWTAHLDEKVWRKTFKEIIAYDLPPPKTPEEAVASLVLQKGFKAEIAVAEPEVVTPVAFDWDAKGRMWVAEMRDYPTGMDGKDKPGGTIRCLEDLDKDGRYETSTVFLDELSYPTGVIPWRGGVIICAVPDILYAEDTNHDGKADVRKVLYTGFKPGNQQHRANGFVLGLDGWIYGANGDSGGAITAKEHLRAAPLGQGTSGPVDISGRDFRFDPDGGRFETATGNGQYARQRDDYGNWFANHNSTWLWHYTFEEHYLRRNPNLALKSVKQMLANYPESDRVFVAGKIAPRHNDPHREGRVTSACSVAVYRDDLFGPDFASSIFICEPVYNIVHREVLTPDGATFTSKRAPGEAESEFIGSTDPWFRPVSVKTGPDGALYVADMARYVLEHPEWIAPETQSRIDLRAGENLGRIFRILPATAKRRDVLDLSKLNAKGLVAAMDNPNGWQRDTVMRLLMESYPNDIVSDLSLLASASEYPQARVQALATLLHLNPTLRAGDVKQWLQDPNPHVREQAIKNAEKLTDDPALFLALKDSVIDSDFRVRRQLALTLGTWNKNPSARALLEQLILSDGKNPQMRSAIISSLPADLPIPESLHETLASTKTAGTAPTITASNPDRLKVVADYLSKVPALKGDAQKGRLLFNQTCALCHRLKGEGHEVGPDLGMVATKPLDWLITGILDPNAAIEDRYRGHQIETKEGGLAGVISAETSNSLTVRMPGGQETPVLRNVIKSSKRLEKSLMPDGLEGALSPQDTADLIEWVRQP